MNVLVTAIGSMSAECVVSSLETIGLGVVATDIYPERYHPVAKRCRAFVQVPQSVSEPEGYVRALLEAARRHGCRAVIPLTDPEVDVLSPRRAALENAGLDLWLARDEAVRAARSKALWGERLSDCQSFRTIPSYASFAALAAAYQGDYVAKRENGRSSEGIVFGNTGRGACADAVGYIYQPFIVGDILAVDFACHPKTHTLACVARKERLRTKNGAGTVVEIVDPGLVRPAVAELVDRLRLTGVMNCEFIRSDNGLYLMDINPRFSAGVSFSKLAGYDFVAADAACYLDGDIPPVGPIGVGSVFVKRFVDFA